MIGLASVHSGAAPAQRGRVPFATAPLSPMGRSCPVDEDVASASPEIRLTEGGRVRGATVGDTYAFRGIPYAAPPVGELRWRPPQPAPCWSGVREALAFGEACAQSGARPGTATTWFGGEDCLYLSVWTPRDPPVDR